LKPASKQFFPSHRTASRVDLSQTKGAMNMDARFSDFAAVLHANAPNPEHAGALQLYGRFVGDWDSQIIAHSLQGARHHAQGEIHFGWILEGRAIQDVWMIPHLADRATAPPFPIAGNWYGTTIRVYDPTIEAWRITWIDPARRTFRQQIGRARGKGHRAGRHDRIWRFVALEFYQDHREILSLAGRSQAGRGFGLATRRRSVSRTSASGTLATVIQPGGASARLTGQPLNRNDAKCSPAAAHLCGLLIFRRIEPALRCLHAWE
jgi:hypothetical protein